MPEITPFINLCSYVSMFSLAMMLLMIFLFRFYKIQGKDYRVPGFFLIVFSVLFAAGVMTHRHIIPLIIPSVDKDTQGFRSQTARHNCVVLI